MTHKTRGIVLRTIKYGETSLVVTVFTELFGIQTYLVNGVRSAKKSGGKASLFQPAAQLELVVYHSDTKSMQRIREFGWQLIYQQLLQDVIKNSVACYMVELLFKCLKQPEANPELYQFCEEALLALDKAPKTVTANFALFFTLHLAHFFGFRIIDNYSSNNPILDLTEGGYTSQLPHHPHFLEGDSAFITSQLLKVMQPAELEEIPLNHLLRRQLLIRYLDYYALHIPEFGQMKTLMVLHEVL